MKGRSQEGGGCWLSDPVLTKRKPLGYGGGGGGRSDHPTLLSLDFYLKLFFLNLAVLALSCGWQNLVP